MSSNQTHSREIQHTCRSSVQNKQTNLNRKVTQSINCECNFSHGQISQHRSICNTSQSQIASICVTNSRQERSNNRCCFSGLESHPCYAFPPFHLIQAVLKKIHQSQCKVVLIAPLWPNRSWFPELSTHNSCSNTKSSGTITRKISTSKSPTSITSHAWEY